MADHLSGDFSQLTLATCQALVGQDFVRPNEAGPDVVLCLLAAEPVRRDPTATGDSDRPFSLLFRGPPVHQLTQGQHDLEHAACPLAGIFLVPVGNDEQGPQYEAIFS